MERFSQPPKPECCRREGKASAVIEGSRAEQLAGSVHREIRRPQVGVAPRLSNSASKPSDAGEDAVLTAELNTTGAAKSEATVGLPGSKSVAREEETVWNLGGPECSRRTNCECQAGRVIQRQEGNPQANRESDRFIVVRGNPVTAGPNWMKGATRGHRSIGNPIRTSDGPPWANLPGAHDQRVLVKSPVRKNCTPGSVRGAPGNRRPYLDKMKAPRFAPIGGWGVSCF